MFGRDNAQPLPHYAHIDRTRSDSLSSRPHNPTRLCLDNALMTDNAIPARNGNPVLSSENIVYSHTYEY